MLAANIGCLINAAIFVVYFLVAKDGHAWPAAFNFWSWTPFVVYFTLHHFFDGVQNTTRNIARIYLLQRDGLNYDNAKMQHVWQALIPNAYLPVTILWHLSSVASFACLLIFQGWATGIIAHAAVTFFGGVVPINYSRHLKRIQAAFPQKLTHEQAIALAYCGISLSELRSTIDQAVAEGRDPQQWWGEVLHETTARTIEQQKDR